MWFTVKVKPTVGGGEGEMAGPRLPDMVEPEADESKGDGDGAGDDPEFSIATRCAQTFAHGALRKAPRCG